MRVFAKRVADARRADEIYRRLSAHGRARRLKIARKGTKQPETTCPYCRYDLSGLFRDDPSLRPCPECGELVSPGAAVLIWCHKRRAFDRHTSITVFSGLFQALLAWIYIMLAGFLGGSEAVQTTLLVIWIIGVVLNAIFLPFNAWHMQLAANPNRHPVVGFMLSALYTCGSLGSTLLFFFLIPAGIVAIVSLF